MPRPIRIPYTIPSGAQFGAVRAGGRRTHQGCDYHCPIGTPIYGTGDDGVVTHIGYNPDPLNGSGNNVVVKYGNRITTDMHMRERTPLHVGSIVNHDTIIGYVGLTGNAVNASPPGSHDHHQMTVNGKLVDPEVYYGTTTAGGSAGTRITEENIMAHAVVVQDQTDQHFNWIAVVTESGTLHEVDPKNRAWWNDLAACYDPVLTAKPVTEQQYKTFVAANQPTSSTTVNAPTVNVPAPIDYAALAKAVNDDAAQRLSA